MSGGLSELPERKSEGADSLVLGAEQRPGAAGHG